MDGSFINVKTSKTGELAEIPLFPLLREELEQRPRKGEYVFQEAAAIYLKDDDRITALFKQALKDAGIEGTHVMRHKDPRSRYFHPR